MKKKIVRLKDLTNLGAIKRKVADAFSERGKEAADAIRALIDELEQSEVEVDEEALAEQIKTFTARKNAAKNKRESLKSYLAAFLNGKKWQNSEVAISWRKSEAVEVEDGAAIPEKYLRYKEPEINKALLKTDLKSGEVVDGCQLVTKNNIQVK